MAARGASMMVIVTVGVLVLVLGSTGLVAVSSLTAANRSVDELWLALADSKGEQAVRRTLEILMPVVPFADVTDALLEQGRLSPERPEELLEHLSDSLVAYPDVTWMSWGQEDGVYLAAVRWPKEGGGVEIRRTWRTLLDPSAGPDPKALAHWRTWAEDGAGGWRLVEDTRDRAYDPRARPWYRAALGVGPHEGAWIDPYVMLSRRQTGIGYAHARRDRAGRLIGVLAAEFEAAPLSRFLETLELGQTGRVYLVDEHGQVIAHPTGDVLDLSGPQPAFHKADAHPDPKLSEAWQALGTHARQGRAAEVGEYLAMVKPFPASTGIPWAVVMAVPAREFFGDARDGARQAALVAALAALAALLLGVWLSRQLTRSVRRIEAELHRISDFDLDGPRLSESPSFLREVNVMAVATDRMKHGLRSFARYIPYQLVRQLLRSGREARLGGEAREVTVLFSDIEGFTPTVEATPTDLVLEALGDYLGAMNEAIEQTDGTVCQYLGDAVMAFWGAPETYADHAIRACRGALAMRARAEALVATADERGHPPLPTRFGVNSGEVMVGNIGAPNRFNYAILGDPVNTAARIEGLNKVYGTQVLVGARTAELVGGALVLRAVDWVRMKGKTEPVLVYELVGEPGEVPRATRDALARYGEALQAYRARRFADAAAGFEAVDEALGGDPPSRVMAARSREFEAEPPPEGWDGTHAMRTK